jgi:carboxyl-terminal processing protease
VSSPLRAFAAALIVAAAAFAGAWYVGYHNGLLASQAQDAGGAKFASLDLGALLGSRGADEQLVALAFRQVERVYYKPVEAQTLVNGERSGLLSYIRASFKSQHTAVQASLPATTATGDQVQDLHAMDRVLAYAQDHYARYLGNDARTNLTQAAISGMLGSLNDPYTVYLSPDQIRALDEQLNGGNFGGIGVFIYQLKNGQVVLQPIEGLPAARAGMRGEEVVQSVNGSPIGGLALDKVERMIRGPQGSKVSLVTRPYAKSGPVRRYSITREIIHVPTVHQKMEGDYNYIRLSDFGETSADEVRKALLAGKAHHAKATILDLRDNGGGLLDAAVSISSFFIPSTAQVAPGVPKGVVVTEIDRQNNQEPLYANGSTLSGVTPLVVLVNGFTASASEITAGALQDYKIATLIGTKTFGKGVVQGIFSMPNGGALKITTQRYVTPAGRDIQHKGIEPNILVAQSPEPDIIDTPADKQLQAAKAFLNRATR